MQIYFISDHLISTHIHLTPIHSHLYNSHTDTLLLIHVPSDLNRLVMDYLVIEGYKEAAENFARESGMSSSSSQMMDFESIQNRMIIRNAIHSGDIIDAIERVNDFDPEVSFSFLLSVFHPQSSAICESKLAQMQDLHLVSNEHRYDYNTMHHSQVPCIVFVRSFPIRGIVQVH